MMFLGDLVRRNCVYRPDAPFVRFEGRAITHAQFRDASHRLSHALLAAGVRHQDHVAVLAKNCPEYFIAYFGCAGAGAIITCVNYRLSDREFAYVITNAEAKVLLLDSEFVEAWERIKGDCPNITRVIVLCGPAPAGYESYEDFVAGRPATPPDVALDENDVALQMYTSGTTGVPKGAMLTHRNLIADAMGCAAGMNVTADDISLVSAPLYHMAAGMYSLTSTLLGGTTLLHRDFDPVATLDAIERDRVTRALMIPAMILFCLQVPGIEERDLSSLREITYGASPIPYEVLNKAMATFGCDFLQAYGQTESTAVFTLLRGEDHTVEGERGERLRMSAGREILGCEVRVVNEDGSECERGQWGEVLGRGPNVMKGYWNMPEATAHTIRDGWLWTGDIGYMDEEGYLYIVDRSKDMIISGGENIYPREIEEVLYTHPDVADAAVIGIPNAKWGEEVKACVVLKEGATRSEAEIIAFCRDRLAHYKCPRSVDFIALIPRNLSGKVLKKELRAPYWEGKERLVH